MDNEQLQAVQYMMVAIEWAIVPLILGALLRFSLFCVPGAKAELAVKMSASAGAWAGLVVFVLFVISQKSAALSFSFALPAYGFRFWPTILSALGGFGGSRLLDAVRRHRVVGLFVMVLVASSAIALFSYVFVGGARPHLVFVALGGAFGVLVHQMLYPHVAPSEPAKTEKSQPV